MSDLTDRELQILRLLAAGHRTTAIATRLWLGRSTVRTHTIHLYAKLGVHTAAHAVHVAHERGILGAREDG